MKPYQTKTKKIVDETLAGTTSHQIAEDFDLTRLDSVWRRQKRLLEWLTEPDTFYGMPRRARAKTTPRRANRRETKPTVTADPTVVYQR